MWQIRTQNDLEALRESKLVSDTLAELVDGYFHQFAEASNISERDEFCKDGCAIIVLDPKIDDWKTEVGFYDPLWLKYVEAINVGEEPTILKAVRMLDNESLVTYFVQTGIDAEIDEWLKQYATV
jgi:hypothetical protein